MKAGILNKWFWSGYSRRAQRREDEYFREHYWCGRYVTWLEKDMIRRTAKYDKAIIDQFQKMQETGIPYFECVLCHEEKHVNNFSEEQYVARWVSGKGWQHFPKCNKCQLEEDYERMLEGYCYDRVRPIIEDRIRIRKKLHRSGLPYAVIDENFELIELERTMLNTKRELKNINQ